MVTLAAWGDTPEEAQGRAKQLASDFGATDYTFAPMGAQRELGVRPAQRQMICERRP